MIADCLCEMKMLYIVVLIVIVSPLKDICKIVLCVSEEIRNVLTEWLKKYSRNGKVRYLGRIW